MKTLIYNILPQIGGGYYAERRQGAVIPAALSPMISMEGGQRRKGGNTRLIDCGEVTP